MMYSTTAQAEPARTFPYHHERHRSQSHTTAERSPRPYEPRHVELPRPLEPRHSHAMSPAYNDSLSRRTDHYHPAPHHPPPHQSPHHHPPPPPSHEYRPQTLPRLQDILTSTDPVPSPPAPSHAWPNHPAPPFVATPRNRDGHYSHSHPSTSHAPPIHESLYHHSPAPRPDVPLLQTSAVPRHDSHSIVPPSPYRIYPESRDYTTVPYERSRQASSTTPYPHTGLPSPYTSTAPEEFHRQSPANSLERPGSDGFPPAGPESSKKYLGVQEVPGEGQFHMYEGGYRIPTQVDGENVNPAWGLTKANKPRKRLAMACLDCREKKIKCEPGANSCLQCEKAKRPCRKAPTHQSQGEMTTASAWSNGSASPMRKNFPDTSPLADEREVGPKRRTMEERSPTTVPAKKHRSASPAYALSSGAVTTAVIPHHHAPSVLTVESPPRGLALDEDPFAVDPDTTQRLLEHYFQDVNDVTYRMFPRQHFMQWARLCRTKSQNEKLLLYAMLAMGSIFAEDVHTPFGQRCSEIATEALNSKLGRFGMPVVQGRLLLGLYHFAQGARAVAWDYIGAGIDAATYLRYNTERGCAEPDLATTRSEFNMTPDQLVECKRRTFWSAFLMDRSCGGRSTLINPEDVFLRLPYPDESYDHGVKVEAPYFHNGIIDPAKTVLTANSAVAPMGWLCLIAGIWGDVVNFIYRAVHRSPVNYEEQYEKFHRHTVVTLQDWYARLPDHLQFSQVNTERSIQAGFAGPYLSMHILYHLSWIKLNRFVKHALISTSITRNIRATHQHSLELLQVMSTTRTSKWDLADRGHVTPFSFATPIAGYAIMAAIDVVGAGGLDTHLKGTLDLISCGLESLREVARYWNSAREQDKECEKRYYQIQNILKHPFTAKSGCWLGREWGIDSALEKEFAAEDDCIYGADDHVYFGVLHDTTNGNRGANGVSTRVAVAAAAAAA